MNDHITIKWYIDDVKELNETLTDEQCMQVLQLAKRKHNAEVGINWDVLKYYIDEVKRGEEYI